MSLKYCYHTHTKRCNHAKGEDEDYVLQAINAGLDRLGFSDHAFFPGIYQRTSRGRYELYEDYLESINRLKEKYKDKIEIKIGFEAEYSDRFIDYLKQQKQSGKLDYLILGQHFNFDNGDNPPYIKDQKEDLDALHKYVEQVLKGIETGLFTYIAHPDLYVIAFKQFNEECVKAAHTICKAAEKAKIPLEINAHAIKFWDHPTAMTYPYPKFWEIASQYDIDVIIGYDAHMPSEIGEELEFEFHLIEKYNLHFLKDFKI